MMHIGIIFNIFYPESALEGTKIFYETVAQYNHKNHAVIGSNLVKTSKNINVIYIERNMYIKKNIDIKV